MNPRGAIAGLAAALLFGAGTPLAKRLLELTSPWLLAGLLYLGSGIGLALFRLLSGAGRVRLQRGDARYLIGAVTTGGLIGPVLLMLGLARSTAASASLLLNAESVFTALLAWFVFKEGFDRRIALGMSLIVVGGVALAWPGSQAAMPPVAAAAILGACLAWAVDNNLTRKVSLTDASFIAMTKGLVAGGANLVLAWSLGVAPPPLGTALAAGLVGLISYGASLVLFVIALRHIGAARTGAYFSVAPFFGVLMSVAILGEAINAQLIVAALLMGIGVALHLTERHEHPHRHDALEHDHEHEHGAGDDHHAHAHDPPVAPGTRHSHPHAHTEIEHAHPHFPDAHHRHEH